MSVTPACRIESEGRVRQALLDLIGINVSLIKNSHVHRVHSPDSDTGLSVAVLQSGDGFVYETALWSRAKQTILYDHDLYEDVRQFETIAEIVAEVRRVLLEVVIVQ
jgi:hypothetical protein